MFPAGGACEETARCYGYRNSHGRWLEHARGFVIVSTIYFWRRSRGFWP